MKIIVVVIILLLSVKCLSENWHNCGINYNVMAVETLDSAVLAGSYGAGFYKSTDNGNTWQDWNIGMSSAQITCMVKVDTTIYTGTETEGIFFSSEYNNDWQQINVGLTSLAIHAVAADNQDLFAATSLGVHIKTPDNPSWQKISSSQIGNVIYAIAAENGTVCAANNTGIYFSANQGISWEKRSTGVSGSVYHLKFCNGKLYAGTSTGKIYKSDDYGFNWTALNSGQSLGSAVRMLDFSDSLIIAATYGSGVHFSNNHGQSWQAINGGLSQLKVYSVKINPPFVFAGTFLGVFRKSLSDFTKIDEELNSKVKDLQLDNYPNPFNSQTMISFKIPFSGNAKLQITNSKGQLIAELIDQLLTEGKHTIIWNTNRLDSGVYFYTLKFNGDSITKKMLLVR